MLLRLVSCLLLALASAHAGSEEKIAALARETGGRLGLVALDSASGKSIAFQPKERFRFCSTFKLPLTAAVLQRIDQGQEKPDRRIAYGPEDLLEYAPVTRAHVAEGSMTVSDLCAAAMQVSDNTAANLLLATIGGPEGLTRFLRSVGDTTTRSDRAEPELNRAVAGEERDTTTAAAMVANLQNFFTGKVLSAGSRAQLLAWMEGNTTGDSLIRAGVPAEWKVGDKTGRSGDGVVNDVAILQPPGRGPIFLAIYTDMPGLPKEQQDRVIAQATRLVVEAFSGVQ